MTGLIKRMAGLAVALAVAGAGLAMAGQQRPYRLSDQQLQDLVNRIQTHKDTFDTSLTRAIDRSSINGSQAEEQIDRSMRMFGQATDSLRDRVNDRQSDIADAEDVLRRATAIDEFMMRNQLDASARNGWQALRRDMSELARAYGITWNWNAASQTMPARVDDKQVEQLLKQIGKKADRFEKGLDRAFYRSPIADEGRAKDELRRSVKDFSQATDRLGDRVKGRQSNTLDVEDVLRRGVGIDTTMQRYQLSAPAEKDWLSLRGDLDSLARAYNVAWSWSNPGYTPAQPIPGVQNRLTGTYQFENARSEDPRRAVELAVRQVPADQRQRTYESLLARLEAPDQIAIERHENSVTMASTRGGRVTFEADGRDHSERWGAGRTMNTRATLEGDRLIVATTGNRGQDYTATFDPTADGRSLRVTRTIDAEGLRQPVTVRSSYRRLSDDARWNVNNNGGRDPYNNTGSPSPAGGFVLPRGSRLVASLDEALSTANAREGDLYSMTVSSPSQYDGAVIQGTVSSVSESGRLAGRSGMTLDVRSIRLRNGSSYPFDGVIEDIRTPDGETAMVDREGTIETEDSQTRKAVERGAIGAALGAVIGALAGGGKGAAIGAAIGAGAGAGSVIVGGRDRLDLPRGTVLTVASGDPTYQRTIPNVMR